MALGFIQLARMGPKAKLVNGAAPMDAAYTTRSHEMDQADDRAEMFGQNLRLGSKQTST
jgi:hypothetical protein